MIDIHIVARATYGYRRRLHPELVLGRRRPVGRRRGDGGATDSCVHTDMSESTGNTGAATARAAILERLLCRSVIIKVDGDSYRPRAHQACNETLRKATTVIPTPLQ